MASAVMEKVMPVVDEDEDIDYEYELRTWGDDYRSPKFRALMDEALAEEKYMKAHPEEYKVYDSFKELLRDAGFDVSNLPDD